MKIFSPALKRQIKDCILAILRPKKEIYAFFKDHSCPNNVLKTIEGWDDKGLSRAGMIDSAFDALSNMPDNGLLHFNLMLDSLCGWNHFDDYWFNAQKKLDLQDAKKKIAALRTAKDKDIDKARKRVAQERERVAEREERHSSLEEMRQDFYGISMESVTPQKRGYAFEQFLGKMARYFGLKVTDAFRVTGTQIDGTVKYEGENYTVEAKWHDRQLSDEPLMAFCHKQEINMHGRGLFISINGFTEGALRMLARASIKNTVLMDGEDIALILTEMITLPEALDKKIHAAQTRGCFYVNAITGKSKIPE